MSTKKQGDRGVSRPSLFTSDHSYKHQDKDVTVEFTDIQSGREVINRPALAKVLALCRDRNAIVGVAPGRSLEPPHANKQE